MDLRDDAETDPGQPGFDNNSSEHFLKAHAEKNKKKNSSSNVKGGLLSPDGGDEDCKSDSSKNSKYKTKIKNSRGQVKDGFVWRKKTNPRHETYLENPKEIPESFKDPKFLSSNYFEKVGMANYQKSGSNLLRKYIENITYVLTGSDGDLHTDLDKQLKDAGLVGESILGNKVWIGQTNFPEEMASLEL